MSWTFHNSNGATASASSNSIAVALANVSVGDLIAVWVKWEAGTTTCAVSDGTTSLTQYVPGVLTYTGAGEPSGVLFYLLSSVASGTVTYTASLGAARTWRDIVVMSYTPSAGTVAADGTAGVGAQGQGTAVSSGNVTTTGTDGVAFGGYSEYGSALTSPKINNVVAAQTQKSGATNSELWSITYSSGFTGAATGTITFNNWVGGVIAFKITASGAAPVSIPPRMTLLGVGP